MTTIPPSLYKRLVTTPLVDIARGRLTGRLAWREAIAAADLPDELKACITGVVKKTRLWRSEKFEVAHELIGHFRDGLDAGVDEPTLRDRFGNTTVAAKLIRRAKVRNRPLVWHVWHRSLQVACVMCAVYLGLIIWFANQEPVFSVNYLEKLNQQMTAQPDAAATKEAYIDLWTKYHFGETQDTRKFPALRNEPQTGRYGYIRLGDAKWPKLERYLNENQELIQGLRDVARKPQHGFKLGSHAMYEPRTFRAVFGERKKPEVVIRGEDRSTLIGLSLYHYVGMWRSFGVLQADMDLAIKLGDAARFIDDYKACVGIARQVSRDGFVVSCSVGNYQLVQASMRVAEVLKTKPEFFSDHQLRDLFELFQAESASVGHDFVVAEWEMLDLIQRCYTDDGKGNGRLSIQGMLQVLDSRTGNRSWLIVTDAIPESFQRAMTTYTQLPFRALSLADRAQVTRHVHQRFEANRKWVQLPLWELLALRKELDSADESDKNSTGETKAADPFADKFAVVNMFKRDRYDRTFLISLKATQAQLQAFAVAVVLELYKRRHGAYPQSLSELVPEYFPQIPVDHSTGLPLLLRYENGKPVLYGRGPDGKDDGGELPRLRHGQDETSNYLPSLVPGQPKDWVLYPIIVREPAPE